MDNNARIMEKIGLKVVKNEDLKKEIDAEGVLEATPPLVYIDNNVRDAALKKSLIPKEYADSEFDKEKIKSNIIEQNRATRKFKVKGFNNYIKTLNSIITGLRAGQKPRCSYIIGAPNGFGKTSFANTCIKIMYAKNMDAVPYISLFELAEIRKETEKEIARGLLVSSKLSDDNTGESYYTVKEKVYYRKQPEVITGDFSWSEYMNAEVLFCYFSSLSSKEIESHILRDILEIRGVKGLPTMVFMSTSLDPYKNDRVLREYIWGEILANSEETARYDRVFHVSCYKKYMAFITDEDSSIDTDEETI